jgi:hypothetical protein
MIKLFLLLLQVISITSYNIKPAKYVYSNYVEQWDCGEIPWEHENNQYTCADKVSYNSQFYKSKRNEIKEKITTLKRIKSAKDALGKTVYNNMISMDNFLLELQGINYPRNDIDFAIMLFAIVTFRGSILYHRNTDVKQNRSNTYRLFFTLFTVISVVFTKNVLSAT